MDGQRTNEKTSWQTLSHPDGGNSTLKCISTLHPYFYVKLFDKKNLKPQYFSQIFRYDYKAEGTTHSWYTNLFQLGEVFKGYHVR